MSKKFYVTTPIYYVTDVPHIGHLYTTVAADVLARYHRLKGEQVWFLTGTDEHGQKIQKKAKELGETPQQLADRVVERYKQAWVKYGITHDDFIRTTEQRHKKVVQHLIKRLMDSGDIYLGNYEGWYCLPDEAFWTETQVVNGCCPDCGRPVERLQEESYFFRMSAYGDKLLHHIEQNPGFILPESRKNEVVSFIKQGLKDISISRTTIQWGIPMPPDPNVTREHKVYVWFDALTNYVSALGPLDGDEKFPNFWPQAVHLVGKDILRFHAVYWPTFLMALGMPLPKRIVAHGWLLSGSGKMSKSLGNVVNPIELADEIGVDGVRFFLFREFVFGQDGEYTKDTLIQRVNADLANDFGNGISRVCSMIIKYLGQGPLDLNTLLTEDSELRTVAGQIIPKFHEELEKFAFERALEQLWSLLSSVNRYIESNAPWNLAKEKDPAAQDKLKKILMHCHESLRIVSLCLLPFIPRSASQALSFLGDKESEKTSSPMDKASWGKGPQKVLVSKGQPLFPRLERA
ncbi:MAG: methionine--tRNA ligase [Deltaproteobacteria bacterium]|nr:methionine--tRNA ligase [Deltaproteobacteria bacterium]